MMRMTDYDDDDGDGDDNNDNANNENNNDNKHSRCNLKIRCSQLRGRWKTITDNSSALGFNDRGQESCVVDPREIPRQSPLKL